MIRDLFNTELLKALRSAALSDISPPHWRKSSGGSRFPHSWYLSKKTYKSLAILQVNVGIKMSSETRDHKFWWPSRRTTFERFRYVWHLTWSEKGVLILLDYDIYDSLWLPIIDSIVTEQHSIFIWSVSCFDMFWGKHHKCILSPWWHCARYSKSKVEILGSSGNCLGRYSWRRAIIGWWIAQDWYRSKENSSRSLENPTQMLLRREYVPLHFPFLMWPCFT